MLLLIKSKYNTTKTKTLYIYGNWLALNLHRRTRNAQNILYNSNNNFGNLRGRRAMKGFNCSSFSSKNEGVGIELIFEVLLILFPFRISKISPSCY